MAYILNVLIAVDQLVNTVFNGKPDETMSSTIWRMEKEGHFWGFLRPIVDFLFRPFGTDHCYSSYLDEVNQSQQSQEVVLNKESNQGTPQ